MGEWKEYKLGDIISLGNGKIRPKETGNIPIYGGNGILGYCNSSNYDGETVIIGRVGAYCGSVYYENRPIWISDNALAVKSKKGYSTKFIYYLLKNLKLNDYAEGSSHPLITQTLLNAIDVLFNDDIEEQKRIASILRSLDDKIDLLHQENKTLEAMAETLFQKWFIEDAKEEWEDGIIADLIDFNPHRKLSKGNKSPFLEMSNLNTSTYCPITWRDREFMSGTKFINGDALLARITPCLENGKTAYVDFLEEGQVGWGSTEFIVMRAKHGLHPFFSYIIAKYQDFRDFAESCMAGSSGRQRVDINNLMNYEIKIPEKKVIDVFNHSINYMVTKMHNNNDEIYSLTQIRNILSFKLMNNE